MKYIYILQIYETTSLLKSNHEYGRSSSCVLIFVPLSQLASLKIRISEFDTRIQVLYVSLHPTIGNYCFTGNSNLEQWSFYTIK
jgi:hypothetical protein